MGGCDNGMRDKGSGSVEENGPDWEEKEMCKGTDFTGEENVS